ncbi:hypothetical protein JDW19_02475 [Paenibacillus polymyxa]|uniref:Uncharacterized protein n=1 Tax=Paenibacillus polymyxa TaxID=1406 RepID=A0A8I1IJG8_PAEPO|nr:MULTISPECIES: hypothetical protein [Paenibacillus]KAF6576561.1 hypothetical protein G9G53_01220 [Paenibacillus sp. EKM206P]KAF6591305.1 hypothetical protein G9G52_02745 [Paenibacillus sp. EKM205P]MBM0631994.1 hypothetical protein [Paenibacillus polymyxa]
MSGNNDKVTAATHWVWTAKAEKTNPSRSVEGQPIWPHYQQQAPRKWLEDGLIQDSTDFAGRGQMDLYELI